MKINTMNDADYEYRQRYIEELETLLRQPGASEVRPCTSCTALCTTHQSASCACECSSSCQYLNKGMSTDGERYPIEEHIIPLVYGLNLLGICLPCWSCEGHNKPQSSEVGKLPRVWFYSRSLIYPRLISEHMVKLKGQQKLNYHWHICMTYSQSDLDSAFSIEPKNDENLQLKLLQKDVEVIGSTLRDGVHELANLYLKRYSKNAS